MLKDTTESRLWKSLRTTAPVSVTNKIFDLKDKQITLCEHVWIPIQTILKAETKVKLSVILMN